MACLRMWLWDDSDRMWQRHNAGQGHKRGFLDMRYPGYIKWIIQIMTGRIFSKELKMMMMLSLYYSLTPMQAWQCICKVYWLINADTQLAWALIRKRTRHGVSEDATVTEREAWRVWGCSIAYHGQLRLHHQQQERNADTQLAWALIKKRTRHGVSEDVTVTEREAWRVWGCKTDRTVTGRERDTRLGNRRAVYIWEMQMDKVKFTGRGEENLQSSTELKIMVILSQYYKLILMQAWQGQGYIVYTVRDFTISLAHMGSVWFHKESWPQSRSTVQGPLWPLWAVIQGLNRPEENETWRVWGRAIVTEREAWLV